MPLNLDARIRQALAESLQDALSRGQDVSVPGFGTFRVVQHSASMESTADGRIAIRPPRRAISFDPDPW
ncbi:MAG TPA: HU family DNA-binding protein [Rhodothermales bacterium]